ncbi:unknown [Prevotella sp. CAG:891]|nr:unknown [Prevotella sp. CAG:891]
MAQCTLDQVKLYGCLFGFFNLGEEDYDESNNENAQCNQECRSGISNLSFGGISNQCAHQDVASYSSR